MATSPFETANLYEFEGECVSGTLSTSSITGKPTGSIKVGDDESDLTEIELGSQGWTGQGTLDAIPDLSTTTVTVVLPQVNVEGGRDGEEFAGFVVLVRHRTSIGGPRLVRGALQSYEVRLITGTARAVEF